MTDGRLEASDVTRIIAWGREMLASPVELLEGVCEVVEDLAASYPLILLTKGDLLHQQTKLARSGLGHHFKGIEIVSEKDARIYRQVMTRYAVDPERFVMVGNSLRSDILPVIQAGGHAVYVPYEATWIHEHVPAEQLGSLHFHEIASIRELPPLLQGFS
jgi:putative hydrolase of the HAD superfamily